MPNVVFANTKGGSGKTTAALLFVGQILDAGARVAILEGDPNRPLLTWAAGRDDCLAFGAEELLVEDTGNKGKRRRMTAGEFAQLVEQRIRPTTRCLVIADEDDQAMLDWLEVARTFSQFVVSDPEGSPNAWMTSAISQADLVVIPFAPTALDAAQVVKTIASLNHFSRISRREVPFVTVLTKVGHVMTKDERNIRDEMESGGVPVLAVSLFNRAAFRAMFARDALLSELPDREINGLDVAKVNAAEFANEIIGLLRAKQGRAA